MTFDQSEHSDDAEEIRPTFQAGKLISVAALAAALIVLIFLLSLAF